MATETFLPGPQPNTVKTLSGQIRVVPNTWELLLPGDAALTRRVKAAGEHLVVQEKVGRRVFSRGIWAPRETISRIREELAAERSTERYAKKQLAESKRREKAQQAYVEDFRGAVVATTEPPDYFLAADFVVSCLGFLFFLSFFCALLPLPILRPPCVKLAQDIDVPVQIVENPGIFGGFGRTVMNFGPAS